MILFLVGQALVILAGVLGSHVSTRTSIAEVRGMLTQLQISVTGLREDHSQLKDKVDGISRHVAIIEGMEMEKSKHKGVAGG
ncbi:MAG: hypothetical protein ACYTBS_07440 [Planctomycetota bacterium]|jgi:hypothetical protein